MARSLLMSLGIVAACVFPAVSAGAVAESEWLDENQTFSVLKLTEEKVTLSGGPVVLQSPSLSLVLECLKESGSGKVFKGGSDEFALSLSSCKVVKPSLCEVSEPVKLEVKTELIKNPGEEITYYRLVALKEKQRLGTFFFKGALCSLKKEPALKGELAVETSPEPGVEQAFEFSEGLSKEVEKELKEEEGPIPMLKVGESEAFLTGAFEMTQAGARAGDAWALASPTRLCNYPGRLRGDCGPPGFPNPQVYPANTTLRLENESSMRLAFSGRFMTCTESVLEGATSQEVGLPLAGAFGSAYFAGCTGPSNETCRAFLFGQPYPFLIVRFRGQVRGNGYFWWSGMMVELECQNPTLTCVYEVTNSAENNVHAHLKAGDPAELTIPALPASLVKVTQGSDASCSNQVGYWEGPALGEDPKYKIVTPKPLYATE